MLCQECKKRDRCVALCDEAEEWVDQDYVAQQEFIPDGEIPDLDHDSCFDGRDLSDLSPNELKGMILLLHGDGMSTREIAYHLPCSQQYIAKIVRGDNQKTP